MYYKVEAKSIRGRMARILLVQRVEELTQRGQAASTTTSEPRSPAVRVASLACGNVNLNSLTLPGRARARGARKK